MLKQQEQPYHRSSSCFDLMDSHVADSSLLRQQQISYRSLQPTDYTANPQQPQQQYGYSYNDLPTQHYPASNGPIAREQLNRLPAYDGGQGDVRAQPYLGDTFDASNIDFRLRQQPTTYDRTPEQHQSFETPPRSTTQQGVLVPSDFTGTPPTELRRQAAKNASQASPSSKENETTAGQSSHFQNMQIVENPPNLDEWRNRLFNIDQAVTLSEQEFQIYFPHVDNIYSHRSTQRYKRKPFVSHYWDCRLKGRPPGTPKSDDPNKKKRRRTTRARDICDVKIKITEYFPVDGTIGDPELAAAGPIVAENNSEAQYFDQESRTWKTSVSSLQTNLPPGHPGADGSRYYTIQRVSGGEDGDGGIAGRHKHTLEESDKIKKNTVQRHSIALEKDRKKVNNLSVGIPSFTHTIPGSNLGQSTISSSRTPPLPHASCVFRFRLGSCDSCSSP